MFCNVTLALVASTLHITQRLHSDSHYTFRSHQLVFPTAKLIDRFDESAQRKCRRVKTQVETQKRCWLHLGKTEICQTALTVFLYQTHGPGHMILKHGYSVTAGTIEKAFIADIAADICISLLT